MGDLEIQKFLFICVSHSNLTLSIGIQSTMKHTFLHISDLHYIPDWHEETELVCNKFLEDIKLQIKNFENVYLVFSGDIVLKGEDENQYSSFMNKFTNIFDEIGLPLNRRICVPGNHDISQISLKPYLKIQEGALTVINDEKTFNDNLPQLENTIFKNKFNNYAKYESLFANYTCCQDRLGGTGWVLDNGIGVYCLNTALCSFGGLLDNTGKPFSDKDSLHIDTRYLHRWLAENNSDIRILVMHHPLEWLTTWAKNEIEHVIAENFTLVLSGHVHESTSVFSSRGTSGFVHCVAPQLFSKKSDLLGYAFISIDSDSKEIEVQYRQWAPTYNFVSGTSLAGNDTGKKVFLVNSINDGTIEIIKTFDQFKSTRAVLEAEFDESITCYSSKKHTWVDRDLANKPETSVEYEVVEMISSSELIKNLRSCIIRAPKQFGLSCLGRFMSLEHHRHSSKNATLAMIDSANIPSFKKGIIERILDRCSELYIDKSELAGIILDNWQNDKGSKRVLREIQIEFPIIPIIILYGLDDCTEIANSIDFEESFMFETFYLWALTRSRIRELVVNYISDMSSLDDNKVTKKLIDDIDALNIHRTPLNCLMILKLLEQSFDDSPVNRTEMIGRVLYLLFYQFDKIPRYATRPDLKDCEYALGFVCEWLIRERKSAFTKNEFYSKVQEYCIIQILDLDCEVLFAFLFTENILIRKGTLFEFRFSYWLYFFAAHRMHHDSTFSKYILSEGRYSAIPEIIEFYTGIDRRRSDAVSILTQDLKRMDFEFLKRTGISEKFNPYQNAKWTPNESILEIMKQQVEESVAESTLPAVIKDTIADKGYNPAKPYNQELIRFIEESTFYQMVQTMKGAARALRNSDHVLPHLKNELLNEVISCWNRVCQILTILSPLLAERRSACFEGMLFYLDKEFDEQTNLKRWESIMYSIADNVVSWFQEDIFSKKMGALLSGYISKNHGSLSEMMVLSVMAIQRPPGWEKEIERFIVRTNKNSFYLFKIYSILQNEYRTSFSSERTRQHLRRLAAMSVAKHSTGAKHPNIKLVEKTAKQIEEDNNRKNSQ